MSSLKSSTREYPIPDSTNGEGEMKDYIESLADPKNLHTGNHTLLPDKLYEEWESLASLEED